MLITAVMISISSYAAPQEPPLEKSVQGPSLAERLERIKKEWPAAREKLEREELAKAKTPDEKQQVIYKEFALREQLTTPLLDYIEKNPTDPAAEEVLLWATDNSGLNSRALELLAKHFPRAQRTGELCSGLIYINDSERYLRKILEVNQHRKGLMNATVALAGLLKSNSEQLQLKDPARATNDRKEAEQLLTTLPEKYPDLPAHLKTKANDILLDMRKFGIGQQAPEIEGEDADGQRFKLSDYRGKVVVLDFWANW
jgi:hypothetical protein